MLSGSQEHSVLARACPPVGSEIALRVSFATLSSARSALRIDLEGWILRIEKTLLRLTRGVNLSCKSQGGASWIAV
jgi:hypothetical protein